MPQRDIHTGERPVQQPLHRRTEISYSSSVQEIISGRPGYFVRRGTLIIFGILCLMIAAMAFIRYPDTLEGPLVLTTNPLPVKLKAATGGRLLHLFAAENELLEANAPVAELENNTGYENVMLLEGLADTALAALQRGDASVLTGTVRTEHRSLGDAQDIYNRLVDAVSAYLLSGEQHAYSRRSANLQSQISGYKSLSAVSEKERSMINEALAEADERFRSNEQLFKDQIISRQEYYEETEKLRQKKLQLEGQRRAGLQNNITIAGNDKQMLDLRFEQEEKSSAQTIAIRESIRNLQNFVQIWRLKHLLRAPYKGRIHFLRPLQVNEPVSAGEEICAVVPESFSYAAHVNLPASGTGKVEAGQPAQLLLDQFPNAEFGYVKGAVSSISAMSQKGEGGAFYRIAIALPDSLITSHHRRLPFNAEMTGTARIITADRSLLSRIGSGFLQLSR